MRIINPNITKIHEFKRGSGHIGPKRTVQVRSQSKNGVIVESLTDGKRSNASGSAKVSALGEIAIYTETDDLPLAQVFENIYKHTAGKEAISPKASPEELKKFFAAVLPEYDRERVHVSDIKKVVAWYNLLIGIGMTDFKIEEENKENEKEA